jgi:hypothetical protein
MAKKENNQSASGAVFVGCAVLGVGLGLMFDQTAAGSVIGVGVGFILMGWMRSRDK